MKNRLSPRLEAAAELVRQDAVFADIGTDHAHLPIFLLKEGRVRRVVCSDINRGPLDTARRNAEAAEVSEKIEFCLTDGACALAGKGITDYAICGMGGELIAAIIDRAVQLHSPDVSLVLQPMSRQAVLRSFLYSHGFFTEREIYSRDAGKYYVTLLVKYNGVARELDEVEAELGLKKVDSVNKDAQIGYFKAKKDALEKKINGKLVSGDDVSSERKILLAIEKFLSLLSV